MTKHFRKLVSHSQLAHAYLFTGPSGAGKKELAIWIAQLLFCENLNANGPCTKCSECVRISHGEHPDVVEIAPTGLSIKIEQIRYLKSEFAKSGVEGAQKVFIIEDAEKMSVSAANGLLKFLEEPNGQVTAFLLSSEQNKLLPTIVSRCELVELTAPALPVLVRELEQQNISRDLAILAASLTKNIDHASQLANDESFQNLLNNLWSWYSAVLSNDLRAFVMVQSKLVPLVDTRDKQDKLLFLIALMARDVMLATTKSRQHFVFKMFVQKYKGKMDDISVHKATNGCEVVLKKWRSLAINVSIQNVLESLTLELCDCYHR